ncbi:ATP-binding cassette domain-containing protein [Actinomadura sp. WMMB 499]|uniref:ATP-binding cassette domain-containing protein n=1 Tax=Actinomadura sp. WMMB 499 TaxID=1219491 RepID=UPI001248AA57|nr:ATP-binding cassette domain-containing protein [Actinomadura sp. WMMB 499]QFG22936.1 ATP-binding cassette domain-containing protein [Actinomadura sp. WMMB 499]
MEVDADAAVEAAGLVKRFGDVSAVDGLDLTVPYGTVFGLLGPNGAGKTTAIRMLATLLRPDAGRARVLGRDTVAESAALRGRIGLTGQYASVDEDLTGLENLSLLGRLLGRPRSSAAGRARDLIDAFGLADAAGRQARTYSGGMRRRLDIAASLVGTPELLFLDEPTVGLDPRSRAYVWDVVGELAGGGTTVVLTSQYLDEVDRVADRIAVIDHGTVVAEGTSGELKTSVGSGVLRVRLVDAGQRPEAERLLARELGASVHLESDPLALSVRTDDTEGAGRALARLSREGVGVGDFALGQPSLDEVFLALTGRTAADGAAAAGTAPVPGADDSDDPSDPDGQAQPAGASGPAGAKGEDAR